MNNDNIELLYKKFFIRFLKETNFFNKFSKISEPAFLLYLKNKSILDYDYICGYESKNVKRYWNKINIDNKIDYLRFCKKDIKYKYLKYKKYLICKKINNAINSLKKEPFLYTLLMAQIFMIMILMSIIVYKIF